MNPSSAPCMTEKGSRKSDLSRTALPTSRPIDVAPTRTTAMRVASIQVLNWKNSTRVLLSAWSSDGGFVRSWAQRSIQASCCPVTGNSPACNGVLRLHFSPTLSTEGRNATHHPKHWQDRSAWMSVP